MHESTLEWIAKAEDDFSNARVGGITVDLVCFLCQQCVEKYLKGYLEEHEIEFGKTHNLTELLDSSLSLQPLWESWRTPLKRLTRFAAEFRYPGEWANEEDAVTSLRIATEFRKEIRRVMGLD